MLPCRKFSTQRIRISTKRTCLWFLFGCYNFTCKNCFFLFFFFWNIFSFTRSRGSTIDFFFLFDKKKYSIWLVSLEIIFWSRNERLLFIHFYFQQHVECLNFITWRYSNLSKIIHTLRLITPKFFRAPKKTQNPPTKLLFFSLIYYFFGI